MVRPLGFFLLGALLVVGCSQPASDTATAAEETPAGAASNDPPAALETAPATSSAGIPITSGAAKLSPENTKINFIGVHAKGEPNPRVGEFTKFTGELKTSADGSLEAITAEIETASLTTEAGDKLTNHLQNEDFLDVRTYPQISFKSTKIEKTGDVAYNVTGDLTLHGTTKPVTFPVTVSGDASAIGLEAAFTIDRTEFGMDKLTEGVKKEVEIKVAAGVPTETPVAAPAEAASEG